MKIQEIQELIDCMLYSPENGITTSEYTTYLTETGCLTQEEGGLLYITEKGKAFVKSLENIQLPKQVWIDEK